MPTSHEVFLKSVIPQLPLWRPLMECTWFFFRKNPQMFDHFQSFPIFTDFSWCPLNPFYYQHWQCFYINAGKDTVGRKAARVWCNHRTLVPGRNCRVVYRSVLPGHERRERKRSGEGLYYWMIFRCKRVIAVMSLVNQILTLVINVPSLILM